MIRRTNNDSKTAICIVLEFASDCLKPQLPSAIKPRFKLNHENKI